MVLKQLKKFPPEAFIWIVALITLFFVNPSANHFTICPFHHLGLDFCPGCGLGRSISYLLSGHFRESFESHPLGLFAVIILLHRIQQLIKTNYQNYGTNYRGTS
jgi:hypothetical protein